MTPENRQDYALRTRLLWDIGTVIAEFVFGLGACVASLYLLFHAESHQEMAIAVIAVWLVCRGWRE